MTNIYEIIIGEDPVEIKKDIVVKVEEKKEVVDLPEWLDKNAWSEWEQHRKENKQKLTPLTIKKQIKFLENHKSDHVEIIQTSIRNGWRGLFEIKRKTPSDKEIRNQAVVQVKTKEQEWEKKMPEMTEEERKASQKRIDEIRQKLKNKHVIKR